MIGFSRDMKATAEEITRYMQAHPNAADTAEGVLRWWLERGEFALAVDHVREALDWLVDEGHVVRRTLQSGAVIYAAAARSPRDRISRGGGVV
jgi:Fe2+ or Zn2+ uptake regulation protein